MITDSAVVSISSAANDVRLNIVRTIDKWTVNDISLVDGIHYSLQFSAFSDTITMICQCKTGVLIYEDADGGYFLSNVGKH